MKRFRNLILLWVMLWGLTGCVKYNVKMDVKKNKSMDFSIIYALNSSLLESEEFAEEKGEILEEDDIKNLESKGFTVTEYSEDDMVGYTISKSFQNIDEVSTNSKLEYDLSTIFGGNEGGTNNNYIFTVKRGFLKNTYTVKFKPGTNNNSLDDFESEYSEVDNSERETADFGSDLDPSSLMSTMDLKFEVNLPYPAINNNATTSNNDDRNLTWNLASTDFENIEFGFELYNMKNFYIIIGGVAVAIFLIIALFLNKKKGKKEPEIDDGKQESQIQINPNMENVTPIGTPNQSIPSPVQPFSEVNQNLNNVANNTNADLGSILPTTPIMPNAFNSTVNTPSNSATDVQNVIPNIQPIMNAPSQNVIDDNINNIANQNVTANASPITSQGQISNIGAQQDVNIPAQSINNTSTGSNNI